MRNLINIRPPRHRGVYKDPETDEMVCSICRQPGHNRMTCWRHSNVEPREVVLAPLDARDVIIRELKSEITALKLQCDLLSRGVIEQARRIRENEASASRIRGTANIEKIQEILFTNKESIPDGVYLSLMNALVGK